MIIKNLRTLLLFFTLTQLSAFELPSIDVDTEHKPKIVLFKAESVLVKEQAFYKVTWRTVNATDVQVTYLGKIALSGSITVTEDEFNRGPITLTASSRNSDFSDSKTINKQNNSEMPSAIFVKEKKQKSRYIAPAIYPRGYGRPYRNPYGRRYY